MAESVRVGIVGAGRIARALVARIDAAYQLTVVSRRAGRMTTGQRDLPVTDDPAAVRRCALVLLAVPAAQVANALRWVAPHLGPGAFAVNLATESVSRALQVDGVRLVACKIIGQSGRIESGIPAAFVVDGASPDERALLSEVLRGAGTVLDAPEELVARVNELVARHMIGAQLDLLRELDRLDLPGAARDAAISNLAVGVWLATASGNTGPFLRTLVAEMTEARPR